MEILGIDIGFGFTKATSGQQDLIFKSVLGESTDLQFREQMLPSGPGDDGFLQVEVSADRLAARYVPSTGDVRDAFVIE